MVKIEFRGKSLETWKWVKGDLVQYENGHKYILGLPIEQADSDAPKGIRIKTPVKSDTVCQYSGLKDQLKDNIFDKDIVLISAEYEDVQYIAIVHFGHYEQDGSGGEYSPADCFGWYVEVKKAILPDWMDEDDAEYYPHQYQKQMSLYEVKDRCTIIGNVFDYHELIQE